MCFLPRRALSVSDCEIARAYKVAGSSIEPIAFIVPRKVRSSSISALCFPILSILEICIVVRSEPPRQRLRAVFSLLLVYV
jgi:hypothetical protein